MARLILSLDGQTLAEYNMTKERYTVGRLADNDIRIDNSAVSGHHSLIINILNDSFLEDLNSTNGTYVNGARIDGAGPWWTAWTGGAGGSSGALVSSSSSSSIASTSLATSLT